MAPSLVGIPRAPQGDVITTTIFAGGAPTASPSPSSSSSSPLPIGAIIGGLLGGVFLAMAAVAGWIWWGKLIERQNRKQPRLRSALKKVGQSTPTMVASRSSNSIPRSHLISPVSHKSVSFAPILSPRTSEDDPEAPQTPSPGTSSDTSNSEGKRTPPQTFRTQSAPASASASPTSHPRTSSSGSVPPRGAMRFPAALRGQSVEHAYAPVRPSPLSHATHPPPSASARPGPGAPRPIVHPVVDARAQQSQSAAASARNLLPPPARQMSTASGERLSGASAPSEYSQEGTASEGEPFVKMARAPDGRLYPHTEGNDALG